jgi:hypothetical protein
VQAHYDDLRAAGGEVLVVSFTKPERVAAYLERYPLPLAVVSDPERAAYKAFALERTSWGSFFRLGVLSRYLLLMFRGWRPRGAEKGDDVLQLGGDFVVGRDNRLTYAYRSREPTDRPTARDLLEVIRAAGGKQEE